MFSETLVNCPDTGYPITYVVKQVGSNIATYLDVEDKLALLMGETAKTLVE